jgi:hypothetical protein
MTAVCDLWDCLDRWRSDCAAVEYKLLTGDEDDGAAFRALLLRRFRDRGCAVDNLPSGLRLVSSSFLHGFMMCYWLYILVLCTVCRDSLPCESKALQEQWQR